MAVRSSSSSTRPRSRKTSPISLRDLKEATLILNDFHPLPQFFPAILLARQFVQVLFISTKDDGLALTLFVRKIPIFNKSNDRHGFVFAHLAQPFAVIEQHAHQFFLDLLDPLFLLLGHHFRVPGRVAE